ncbi:MAG: hypothetical protein QOC59_586, partial [Microbacteriaceae bacterium]|nr:hypothetical protein [Microbacteriaceae bacterium]
VAGLRAGAGATAVVLAASALAVAVSLGLHLTGVVGLYESVGAGVAGGLALTALQIVLLPTVVVWAAAWLTGAGFAVGTGSAVGPLGTAVGPLPSVPLLGALPHDPGPYGFAGVLVPVLAGFACALVARRRAGGSVLLTGLVAGLTAAALLGLLAAASAGAAGPGRLGAVGPDPLRVATLVAVEVGLPALLGAAFGGRRRPRGDEPEPDILSEVPR